MKIDTSSTDNMLFVVLAAFFRLAKTDDKIKFLFTTKYLNAVHYSSSAVNLHFYKKKKKFCGGIICKIFGANKQIEQSINWLGSY